MNTLMRSTNVVVPTRTGQNVTVIDAPSPKEKPQVVQINIQIINIQIINIQIVLKAA